jgi:hypothetical protein
VPKESDLCFRCESGNGLLLLQVMERRGAKGVGICAFDENSGVKGDKFDWLIASARHLQYSTSQEFARKYIIS